MKRHFSGTRRYLSLFVFVIEAIGFPLRCILSERYSLIDKQSKESTFIQNTFGPKDEITSLIKTFHMSTDESKRGIKSHGLLEIEWAKRILQDKSSDIEKNTVVGSWGKDSFTQQVERTAVKRAKRIRLLDISRTNIVKISEKNISGSKISTTNTRAGDK